MNTKVKYKNKTPSVVEINGRQYAINLEWRSKQSPDDTPIKLTKGNIKEIRPSADYDCYVGMPTLDESYIQVGFSNKELTPIKTHSLAMSLTGKAEKTELFVFKIDEDTSYILFYQNGIIDPGTDLLGKSDEIEEYAQEIIEDNDLGKGGYHIFNESVEESITQIESFVIQKDKKIPVIRSISFSFKEVPKQFYAIGGAVVVIAFAGAGYSQYSSYIEVKKEQEAQAQRMEDLRKEREVKQKILEENAKKEFEKLVALREAQIEKVFSTAMEHKPEPWNQYGEPKDFLEMCINNIRNSPVFRSTWKLRQASCDGDSVETIYERNGVLNVSAFLAINPSASVNPEGDIATISKQTLYQKKPIDEEIPQSLEESNDAKFNIIGFLQDRPDISYQFNRRPMSEDGQGVSLSRDARNIQRRIFNMSPEDESKLNMEQYDTFVEKLEHMPSEEEIKNMGVEDLPMDKIMKLREAFREDWQQEYLVLRSANSISWFSGLYTDIPGLRVSRVDLNILPNNSIEWVIESPFFYKQ
jgi:hypothetical protein